MQPLLSIIVPIYNEAKTLQTIIRSLADACPDAQIIYVNDGSKDQSLEILKRHARLQDIVLTKENGGKGSAVRHGIKHAQGSFTIIQDADLEYDPQEIHLLLAEAMQNPGSAVFGSRFLRQNPNLYKRYLFGNKALTFIANALYGGKMSDSYTCYKLFPTGILKQFPLTADGFELEAELSCFALKRNMPIREVPISYRPRSLEEGKKIRFADAWKGVRRMIGIRFE